MIAEPWAQFPADRHHDQPFVRHYRARAMRAHQDPQAASALLSYLEWRSCLSGKFTADAPLGESKPPLTLR